MRVCIIGAGLTSLTLAKALVNQKIYVDIHIEKKEPNLSKTRTLGISKSNIEFFSKNIIDIAEEMLRISSLGLERRNKTDNRGIDERQFLDPLFNIIRNNFPIK